VQHAAEEALRVLGVALFPSVIDEDEEGVLAQHVIPPGERLHYAFARCWCEPDESDPAFIVHRAA
jgi:hypothetical protein